MTPIEIVAAADRARAYLGQRHGPENFIGPAPDTDGGSFTSADLLLLIQASSTSLPLHALMGTGPVKPWVANLDRDALRRLWAAGCFLADGCADRLAELEDQP